MRASCLFQLGAGGFLNLDGSISESGDSGVWPGGTTGRPRCAVARVSSCLVAGVVGLGDGPDSLPGLIDSIEKGSIVQFLIFSQSQKWQ